VVYTVSLGKQVKSRIAVSVVPYGNPVLTGYFADPDILYSEKENKYYLYPTSDGFNGWSGTYFKTFSSPDLVQWKDEGVILDLKKDVVWGTRNAWAPTVAERKVNGGYKYYYYFTAAQKIGVAVSDHPAGPFADSGKPLVDFKPQGVQGGQEIDPAVFHDPQSDKYYLYWGNGYMAGVALNDDMVSFEKDAVVRLTPDGTFREGTYVIYRKGTYYFFWSEDDTRSPDYKVRYGTSDSPLGPIHVPQDNIVIRRNDKAGILATGHNSVIQVSGKDEWYIVYHRFTHPNGAAMGGDAGFHREVCIDRMRFSDDGRIMEVVPTL
jgi:beta-xylosidase